MVPELGDSQQEHYIGVRAAPIPCAPQNFLGYDMHITMQERPRRPPYADVFLPVEPVELVDRRSFGGT